MCPFSCCLHEASRDNPAMNVRTECRDEKEMWTKGGTAGQPGATAAAGAEVTVTAVAAAASCLAARLCLNWGRVSSSSHATHSYYPFYCVYTLPLSLSASLFLSPSSSPSLYSAFSASAKCQVQFNNKANNTRITAQARYGNVVGSFSAV